MVPSCKDSRDLRADCKSVFKQVDNHCKVMRSSKHHWHEQVFSVAGERTTFVTFASDFFAKNQFGVAYESLKADEYFELVIQDLHCSFPFLQVHSFPQISPDK